MTGETNRDGYPTSPVEEKTYLAVWESALSRFVSAYYNRPWSMQQGEGLGQNTYRVIEVDAKGPAFDLAGDAEQQLARWLRLPRPPRGSGNVAVTQWELMMQRDHYLPVDTILWDLCRKGVIQPGVYLIKVSW